MFVFFLYSSFTKQTFTKIPRLPISTETRVETEAQPLVPVNEDANYDNNREIDSNEVENPIQISESPPQNEAAEADDIEESENIELQFYSTNSSNYHDCLSTKPTLEDEISSTESVNSFTEISYSGNKSDEVRNAQQVFHISEDQFHSLDNTLNTEIKLSKRRQFERKFDSAPPLSLFQEKEKDE